VNRAKFSLNAFILVVMLCAAFLFFVTITLTDLADRTAVNSYFPIEDTELSVRYSNRKANGIYSGPENAGTLLLEGDFGHDWGAFLYGNTLYINEYETSELNLLFCRLVRVNTDNYSKETLYEDAVLRGQCASGELVCINGYLMPSNYPENNPACSLYAFSSQTICKGPELLFLDPENAGIVYSMPFDGIEESFEEKYLNRTLEEIKQ